MKSTTVAYLAWLLGLFGVCGVHRIYVGRWFSGLLWMGTFGLCGLGQLADWKAIPGMVHAANAEAATMRDVPHWTPPVAVAGPMQFTTHTIVREVIKIRCPYCGLARGDEVTECPRCGAQS